MSHLLNSGSVGNIGLNHMKDVRKKSTRKMGYNRLPYRPTRTR